MDADQIQREDDRLITNDVARAVEERELIAYYQPLVELATGRVVGAEALVRWTMPDGTIVPAALFVPSLDRTDTICGLDWFMAEEVGTFLSQARDTAAFVPVSLNFSERHAQAPGFAQTLRDTISWHGVDLGMARVELGESLALAGDEQVDALVDSVRDLGVVVVVDKFAGGLAGLDALACRNLTHAKIARDYWTANDVASLAELVDAAQQRGIHVSAEGVEQKSEVAKLREAGFAYAQGYLLGEPMDAAAFSLACQANA